MVTSFPAFQVILNILILTIVFFFFFQAEDGIRDLTVTGVQTCALPIYAVPERVAFELRMPVVESYTYDLKGSGITCDVTKLEGFIVNHEPTEVYLTQIGRASCRERV